MQGGQPLRDPSYKLIRDANGKLTRDEAAWKQLMENHPHDDICGCSHDGVHQDNEARFRQVTDTAEAVLVEALEAMRLSGLVPPPSTSPRQTELIAFNPHPWPVATRLRARVLLPEGDDESVSVFDASGAPLPTRIDAIHPRVLRNHYLEQTWGRAFDLTFDFTLNFSVHIGIQFAF
jgi:hypothetical protein